MVDLNVVRVVDLNEPPCHALEGGLLHGPRGGRLHGAARRRRRRRVRRTVRPTRRQGHSDQTLDPRSFDDPSPLVCMSVHPYSESCSISVRVLVLDRPISVYRLGEMPIQSCGQSVSASRRKAGARLNAHTEMRAMRLQRSAREVIYRNLPITPLPGNHSSGM